MRRLPKAAPGIPRTRRYGNGGRPGRLCRCDAPVTPVGLKSGHRRHPHRRKEASDVCDRQPAHRPCRGTAVALAAGARRLGVAVRPGVVPFGLNPPMAATQNLTRKIDRIALRAEVLKLLGFAVLFAVVMLLTAWASGMLPLAGR